MIYKCEYCGKEFKTYCGKRSEHHYCSRKCSAEGRKNLITINCDYCGVSVTRNNDSTFKKSKNHFCSIGCANAFQARNKTPFVCKVCGETFYRSPSWTKQKSGLYCSIKCRNNDSEWAKKSYIRANQIQCHKKGLNRLELAGNEIIKELGLHFENQYLINEKICVDVFIPDYKLIIQWDGDYWHGKDRLFEDLDERQKNRVMLDKSQDSYLRKCGYNELRFWESDVFKRREYVYDNIKRTIQEITR